MLRFAALILALAVGLTAGPSAAKISFDVSRSDFSTVELYADRMTTAPGDEVRLVLRIAPEEGWHSYWMNPGGPGGPTTIDWVAPEEVELSEILWPTPRRVEFPPFVNYGYKGETLLTTVLRVPEDWPVGQPVDLTAQAFWLLCETICISEQMDFRLSLPVEAEPSIDGFAAEIADRAAAARPVELGGAEAFTYQADEAVLRLQFPAELLADAANRDVYFYAEQQGIVASAASQSLSATDSGAALLEIERMTENSLGGRDLLSGALTGVLTVEEDGVAVSAARVVFTGLDETIDGAPLAVGALSGVDISAAAAAQRLQVVVASRSSTVCSARRWRRFSAA